MAKKKKKIVPTALPIDTKKRPPLKEGEHIDGPWIVSGKYRRLLPKDMR